MAVHAYACRITKENFLAIASEKPDFDLEEALQWLAEHDTGYFLRDPNSPFDGHYIETADFLNTYVFEPSKYDDIFYRVELI